MHDQNMWSWELAEQPFAGGGEGNIFDIIGRENMVAKIYHPQGRIKEREDKLKAMLSKPPEGNAKCQVAWPLEILYTKDKQFVGFIMRKIKNVSKIDELYSYDKRNQHSWSWYIQVALNLCAAVDSVHKSGHAIGDLNPANICADTTTGLVTLVDTDSYNINNVSGQVFSCTVFRENFVPPEVHRKIAKTKMNINSGNSIMFTEETDLFALATHIFSLLMNGCHPFACSLPKGYSTGDFQPVENIIMGRFPFVKNDYGISLPKYAPPLTILPTRLKDLFVQAFIQGGNHPSMRPKPKEWHGALQELQERLVNCASSKEHQYYSATSSCPWCRIEKNMVGVFQKIKNQPAGIVVKSSPTTVPPPIVLPQISNIQGGTITGSGSGFWGGIGSAISGVGGIFLGITLHIIGVIIAIGLWFAWMVLAIYLSGRIISSFSIWWSLGMFFMSGIVPFVPLWIFKLLQVATASDFIEYIHGIYSVCTRWFAIAIYVGLIIFIYRDRGVIEIALNVLFGCGPLSFVCFKFSGITT